MQIGYAARFKKDVKRLHKKYPSVQSDLQVLVDQLERGETPGDQIRDLKYTVYKVRVRNSDIFRGKSGGYRAIYYVKTASWMVLARIYAKSDQADISAEEIKRVIDEFESEQD